MLLTDGGVDGVQTSAQSRILRVTVRVSAAVAVWAYFVAALVLDARREPPLTVTLPALGVVPYEHMQSEEDILRVLARGTDEFEALYDPRNRNA